MKVNEYVRTAAIIDSIECAVEPCKNEKQYTDKGQYSKEGLSFFQLSIHNHQNFSEINDFSGLFWPLNSWIHMVKRSVFGL